MEASKEKNVTDNHNLFQPNLLQREVEWLSKDVNFI